MLTIWKYPFPTLGVIAIDMPKGARILSLQVQKDNPTLWALVDPSKELEPRWFRIYVTGQLTNVIGNFIGTYQLAGGDLVFHLFETEPRDVWIDAIQHVRQWAEQKASKEGLSE